MSEKILQIKNLKKVYNDTVVLEDISLDVEKGEVVVLLGPSGCGKSTFLRCINGLEQTQSGSILLKNDNISSEKTKWSEVRQKIGMVFQNYDLFPHLSVLDNIILGPLKVQKRDKDEIKKEAETLLSRVGLLHKINAFPRELSGGQKQRVAIVRALIMKPEIMLFDEVTASLDPEMVREVLDVVLELASNGMTMLIVTHEMMFAKKIADKIVFIDGGKIVEKATPDEFFENPKSERAKQFLNIFEY